MVQQSHNESQNYMLNVNADNTKAQASIKSPQCMVYIQGTAVNILVDSGYPYTIKNLFGDIEHCDSDITPGGYGGTHNNIEMRGYFQATEQYTARKTEERVYVSMLGANILGWPTHSKLQIILDPSQIQPVHVLPIHDTPDDECIAQIQTATRGDISQSELTTATREDTNIQMAM